MRTIQRFVYLLLALYAITPVIAAAQPDDDDSIWRLVGTFNNWNTRDDEMRLSPLGDGRYFLELSLPRGEYEFKFVRNGDWGQGHFGRAAGNDAHALAEPGMNIPLEVVSDDPFAVVLSPAEHTWSRSTPEVTSAVPIPRIYTTPRLGVPFLIDLSESLVPAGETMEAIRVTPHDERAIRVMEDEENPLRAYAVSSKKGRIRFEVQVKANGEWSESIPLDVEVLDRVYIVFPDRPDDGGFDLAPIDGDREWALTAESASSSSMVMKLYDMATGTYLAAVVDPRHEGERFAVVYSRRTETLTTIPGDFAIEREGGAYRLIDNTRMPSSGCFHDPRRPDHFTPISSDLNLFDLTVRTSGGEHEQVVVRFAHHGAEAIPLVRMKTDARGVATWRGRFQFDDDVLDSDSRVQYSVQRTVLTPSSAMETQTLGEFDQLIEPSLETPDWAKQAVWYQIFPERFRNGNEINDPHGDGVYVLPWNAEWHTVHDGEFEAWQARVRAAGENPDQFDRVRTGEPGGRFYNVVWDRRYGGDLQGIMQSLDMLKDMGVTALYLNPVFEGISMHKYDTSDFRHVDDNFGNQTTEPPTSWTADPSETYDDPSTWNWSEADRTFLELINEVHARDMHLIIDGVFNHVGKFHPAFLDVVENGINSPYAEWFTAEFDDDGNLVSWVAWDQPNGWLPKLKQEDDRSLVYPVRRHIFDITRRWMDPNGDGDPSDGIDGWRLDVPLDVGDPFWRDWHDHVKSINPDAYITSEIWSDWESVYRLQGDMFDAQMQYPAGAAMINWLAMRPGMTSTDLADALDSILLNDHPQTRLVQQNLFASHDTDRLVSNLFNTRPPREFDAGNRPQQGEPFDESKPDERTYALSRLALVMQATYVGAPMVYYGAEVGMHGADDPSNRKPRPWPDRPAMENPEDRGDWKLQEFYRKWLRRRAASDVLQLGMVRHVSTGDRDVFAFERRLNDEVLLVVVNKGDEPFALSQLTNDEIAGGVIVPPLDAIAVSIAP